MTSPAVEVVRDLPNVEQNTYRPQVDEVSSLLCVKMRSSVVFCKIIESIFYVVFRMDKSLVRD